MSGTCFLKLVLKKSFADRTLVDSAMVGTVLQDDTRQDLSKADIILLSKADIILIQDSFLPRKMPPPPNTPKKKKIRYGVHKPLHENTISNRFAIPEVRKQKMLQQAGLKKNYITETIKYK